MLIILEGVDGAGKSTLTDRILKSIPGEQHLRMHSGPLKGDPMVEYQWRLKDYVPDGKVSVVADRWHVGELVYGPLYRGASKLTPAMRLHTEMYLDKLGAHKLIVTAPMVTIKRRLRERGEDFLEDSHVGLVWDFYTTYAYDHDWRLVGSDEVVGHITAVAQRKQAAVKPLHKFKTYVGGPHPKHLLLGTKTQIPSAGRPAFSQAFVPYADLAGGRLFNALSLLPELNLGVANAEEEDVLSLWSALGRPNVIALGPDAERAARVVPHQTASEPGRNVHPYDYAGELKGLM